jgi:MoxR-like ATPase
MFEARTDFTSVYDKINEVRTELKKVIIGQSQMIDYLIIALMAEGHVLIEGFPGLAKTLTVKLLARVLNLDYSRIQFTPDLMPSDIIGTSIFNFKTQEFQFHKGPIFANFILADEINRAPAKTQSALFEVMEERQISAEGMKFILDRPFFIIATQNPIDLEGTYRLPEAQLDRFMFRINITYPSLEEEIQILNRFSIGKLNDKLDEINPVLGRAELTHMMSYLDKVIVDEKILTYIAQIIHRSRISPDIMVGGSPRASLNILRGAKAMAIMSGRDFVTPDDVIEIVQPVLAHRLILNPEKEMEGGTEDLVVDDLIRQVEVPK